jgi:hypothetical protein
MLTAQNQQPTSTTARKACRFIHPAGGDSGDTP